MRYPNTRYGNPTEMQYYANGIPLKDLAKRLKRSERSVKDWLSGAARVPWWVPELMRLQHMESGIRRRQMGFIVDDRRAGIVRGDVIDFSQRPTVAPVVQDTPRVHFDIAKREANG